MNNKNADYDYLFKLLLIGNSAVGKSCLLMRYSENEFTSNFYNTIGVDFKVKQLKLEGQNIRLQIWDTAGQDRFRTITCSYYRGAHGIIIVYDITDRESFDNVKTWLEEITKYAQENVIRYLVGNKCDLEDRRQVKYEEGKEFADKLNIPFIETSAKAGLKIDDLFQDISQKILKVNLTQSKSNADTRSRVKLGQPKRGQKNNESNSDCCN